MDAIISISIVLIAGIVAITIILKSKPSEHYNHPTRISHKSPDKDIIMTLYEVQKLREEAVKRHQLEIK